MLGRAGEYPMAAGSAAERAEAGGKRKAAKRGQEVVLTFSMQGASLSSPVCPPACKMGSARCGPVQSPALLLVLANSCPK